MTETKYEVATGIELDKRTYLNPVVYRTECPECGEEVIKDFEQQYLSYPITGVYEPINHYCDNCDNEFSSGEIKVDLVVTIKENR